MTFAISLVIFAILFTIIFWKLVRLNIPESLSYIISFVAGILFAILYLYIKDIFK